MKKDKELTTQVQVINPERQEKIDLQTWTKQFNSEPKGEAVKLNRMANNTPYLPISHIENLLDKYFFGMWSTDNFKWQNVANELVGSIDLRVKHPLSGEILVRTGVGAVQIRVDRDSGKKITNALVADVPHLKAECIKNAAKSLGKVFGRDLGRKNEDVDEFEVLLGKKEEAKDEDAKLFEDEIIMEEVL